MNNEEVLRLVAKITLLQSTVVLHNNFIDVLSADAYRENLQMLKEKSDDLHAAVYL